MANWLTPADVKPFLQMNLSDTTQDHLLQLVIDGTCQAVEEYLRRPVVAREIVTYSDGGTSTIMLTPRVWAISSVVENGRVLTEADYVLYPEEGFLRRRCGDQVGVWYEGMRATVVTYTAGLVQTAAEVPANVKIAAMIGVKFLMRSGPEDYITRLSEGIMIRPDRFPRQALWLLDPYRVV